MRAPTGTLLQTGLSALLGLVLLAGCTDEPEPGKVQTPTSTPTSASASASPTPTPTSAEAQIEATVRAYYAELTHAAQTNDTSKLKTMTTRGCPCYRAAKVINNNRREGFRTPDASFVLVSVRAHDIENRLGFAKIRTREAPYDVLDSSDKVIGHVKARSSLLDLTVAQKESGKWIIANQFDLLGDL